MDDRNAKRRQRWKDDPDLRAKQAERDKKRRAERRKKKFKGRLDTYLKRIDFVCKGKGKCSPTLMGDVKMLSVACLAEVTGRHKVRVQQWLSEGLLPGFSAKKGRKRLFSLEYVRLICEALYETELQNARGDSILFRELVHQKVTNKSVEVCDGEEGRQKSKKEGK